MVPKYILLEVAMSEFPPPASSRKIRENIRLCGTGFSAEMLNYGFRKSFPGCLGCLFSPNKQLHEFLEELEHDFSRSAHFPQVRISKKIDFLRFFSQFFVLWVKIDTCTLSNHLIHFSIFCLLFEFLKLVKKWPSYSFLKFGTSDIQRTSDNVRYQFYHFHQKRGLHCMVSYYSLWEIPNFREQFSQYCQYKAGRDSYNTYLASCLAR